MSKHVETTLMRRVRLQTEVLDLVRSGYSFNQAAEHLGISTATVTRWAKDAGVRSPCNSKWSDLSHRAPTAKKVRAAGGTWQDVADTWSAIEGYVVSLNAAYTWTTNNAPEVITAGKGRLPNSVRMAIVAAHSAGATA